MRSFAALLFVAFAGLATAAESTPAPPKDAQSVAAQAAPDKNTRLVLNELKLTDPAAEAKVRGILAAHFSAFAAWHKRHNLELKTLWSQFDQARAAKDAAGANAALAQIETVYAEFRPQHDDFLTQLATVLTPAQVERVEDVLTVNKVKVTYDAYQAIFPVLTAEQKTVVLRELEAARAEAIDAGSMVEKSAFFKKYKIRIEEGYFRTQGLDAQQFRRAFAAKTKASSGVKSGAPSSVDVGITAAAPQSLPTVIWYQQPAAKWEEALPIGSGRLGAMVFGGIVDERIQFNEDTLWTGHPHDYVRAGSAEVVPEVRRLLADGRIKDAENLARAKMLSDPVRQKAYQPFGDLRLHFIGHGDAAHYRRELDLDTATARTTYEVDGVTFLREVFASSPDNTIAAQLTASQAGRLSFTVALSSPHVSAKIAAAKDIHSFTLAATPSGSDGTLVLDGQLGEDGLRYEARLVLHTMGGTTRVDGATLVVEHADSATLLLVAATSFKNFEDITADPAQRCSDYLSRLDGRNFAALHAAHIADHQNLFRRVSLDLGRTINADLPTDERLRRAKAAGNIDADPALAALEFQYGRYLLIASSRPGSQPANLQGVWNELLAPPWESKWTTNINTEMNYWPAEVANLSECHEPLFDLIGDLTRSGARTAHELYRARGWVVHHNTDLWRGTAPINNIDGVWPTGGAWLCYHLWEHWLFTRDRDFLARRAYPALRDAALFFVDTLQRDGKTGWLVTTPSFSPEQGTMTAGPTMDNQLIRSLWENTIAAARMLGVDADLAQQLAQLLPQLPPNQIGQHGQLQEWVNDVDVPNNAHRHMSPLWALYPGADITPADPKVYAAAKTLLTWRGDGSTGWSYAWRIPLWARVGDGEFAYRQLSFLLTKRTLPNLFDLCGPFQIDGNFGACAGVAEMLLQSHQRADLPDGTDRHVIELLPALPKTWATGAVTGLRARGGFEIAMKWESGRLTQVELRSVNGEPCVLRCNGKAAELSTTAGSRYRFNGDLLPR